MKHYFIYSIYGVANALTFKAITDDVLEEIQQFVQHDLIFLWQSDSKTCDQDRYFGQFSSAPEKFVFSSD